jgi:ATP-dependent DNA helicase RecG
MNERIRQLEVWMQAREGEHFEFKEAKQRYDFEELVKYCVALANEGGGRMMLGVTDNYRVG